MMLERILKLAVHAGKDSLMMEEFVLAVWRVVPSAQMRIHAMSANKDITCNQMFVLRTASIEAVKNVTQVIPRSA